MTIGDTINSVIVRFGECLLFTKGGVPRKRFPSTETKRFCGDLDRMIQILDDGSGLSLEKAKSLSSAITVIASSLHKTEGIYAFHTVLDTLRETLVESLKQKNTIDNLQRENEQLQTIIMQLESDLERLMNCESHQPILEWKSALAGLPKAVTVLLALIVSDTSTGVDVCVVHYVGDEAWLPPEVERMQWISVGETSASAADVLTDAEGLEQLSARHPVIADQLFLDFFDPNVVALLNRDDTLGVWPTATFVGDVYCAAIAVSVVAEGCHSKAHGPLPATINTSSGREVSIVRRRPCHLNNYSGNMIDCGSGLGMQNYPDSCGSLAALVRRTGAGGETYFLTAEHVVEKMLDTRGPLVAELPMTLVIPSPQARKRALYCALRDSLPVGVDTADGVNDDAGDSHHIMNKILRHYGAPGLYRALGQAEGGEAITLKAVHDFIFSGHEVIIVEPADVVRLTDAISVPFNATEMVSVSGDLALIPLPESAAGTAVPLLESVDFQLRAVITVQQVVDMLTHSRGPASRDVALRGAASRISQGRLRNLIHINQLAQYTSAGLRALDDPTMRRVLLGQYVVDGRDFGRPGDSGGLVSMDFAASEKVLRHGLGVFVGAVDSQHRTAFVVSPLSALPADFEVWLR